LKVPSIFTGLDISYSEKVHNIHKERFCVVTILFKLLKSNCTKPILYRYFQVTKNRKWEKHSKVLTFKKKKTINIVGNG